MTRQRFKFKDWKNYFFKDVHWLLSDLKKDFPEVRPRPWHNQFLRQKNCKWPSLASCIAKWMPTILINPIHSNINFWFSFFLVKSCFRCNISVQSLEVRKAMFRIVLERRASTYIIQAVTCKNYALFSKDFAHFWVHGWEGLRDAWKTCFLSSYSLTYCFNFDWKSHVFFNFQFLVFLLFNSSFFPLIILSHSCEIFSA